MLSWSCNSLATWCKELTHWKRPWCWGKLRAGGEGNERRWVDWMASPTQWTCVWADSGRREWRTGKPGVLQFRGGKSWLWLNDWTTATMTGMKPQKTSSGQNNAQKENQSWRNHGPWLQTILPIYSKQDSTLLAPEQKYS